MEWYNKEDMLAESDLLTVAESIGLRTVRRGSRVFIECPNPAHVSEHDSNKALTNCYIGRNPNTGEEYFTCKSCGCHGNALTMIMKYEGMPFREACKELSIINCGSETAYLQNNEQQVKQKKEFSFKRKMPSPEELKLIGLGSKKVFSKLCPVPRGTTKDQIPDTWELYDEGKGLWAGQTMDINPLLTLLKEDEETFNWLIVNKASEKLDYYNDLLMKSKHIKLNNALTKEVIKVLGLSTYQDVLNYAIRKLEDVIIRYGGVVKQANPFSASA